MKALTLQQPWAWAVMRADKDVENRTWAPSASIIGQRIAIHAGQKWDDHGVAACHYLAGNAPPPKTDHPAGAIVGTVVVAGYFTKHVFSRHQPFPCTNIMITGGTISKAVVDSRWASGRFCWVLTNPIELPEPIPCRGAQGLWEVPPGILKKILGDDPAHKEAT